MLLLLRVVLDLLTYLDGNKPSQLEPPVHDPKKKKAERLLNVLALLDNCPFGP